jgi:hypothetical protein
MVGAQARQFGKRREQDRLGEMLLDIGRDDSLLPGGKPAAHQLLSRRATLLQAQQLMRQHAP